MCPGLVVGHLVGPSEFRAVVPTPSPMGIWGHTACLQLIGAPPPVMAASLGHSH